MPFQRVSPVLVLFTLTAFQSVGWSSPFSSSNIAKRFAPAFAGAGGGAGQSADLARMALFAEQRSHSPDLSTALEWLAQDRFRSQPQRHEDIRWFHPHAPIGSDDGSGTDDDDIAIERMPLYPVEAVHVPFSGDNCTFVNIEPKNVKMAMDLANGKWKNSLFCASLRARDTARVASVGTILQLLDTDDRSVSGATTWHGERLPTLNRVVATCRAVGIVDILSTEARERGDEEYLVARVRVRHLPRTSPGDGRATGKMNGGEDADASARQAIEDYQKVKSIYINSQSLANNELPKFARQAVQTLPAFDEDAIQDNTTFWKLAETWQTLCNTIRQAKQTTLQSFVNEVSVQTAMQAKGPLELPVKRKNLPVEVQRQLEEIEQHASRDFVELGMDPILDFQEIISMRDHRDRVEKLGRMMSRERKRLEAKESLIEAFFREELGDEWLTTNYLDDGQTVFD